VLPCLHERGSAATAAYRKVPYPIEDEAGGYAAARG